MQNRIDRHPERTTLGKWIVRLTATGFALAAAIISYNDGLFLVRLAGASGRVAYLYPLLPDGLIVISSVALYEAARMGARRPGWATTGVVLGAGLTLAMNAAAGAAHSWVYALIDGIVPVVFFVALEILVWLIRLGRGGVEEASVPANSTPCRHGVAESVDEAIRLDWEHRRECLGEPVSQRALAARWEVSRAKVAALDAPPAPEPSLNGSAPHE